MYLSYDEYLENQDRINELEKKVKETNKYTTAMEKYLINGGQKPAKPENYQGIDTDDLFEIHEHKLYEAKLDLVLNPFANHLYESLSESNKASIESEALLYGITPVEVLSNHNKFKEYLTKAPENIIEDILETIGDSMNSDELNTMTEKVKMTLPDGKKVGVIDAIKSRFEGDNYIIGKVDEFEKEHFRLDMSSKKLQNLEKVYTDLGDDLTKIRFSEVYASVDNLYASKNQDIPLELGEFSYISQQGKNVYENFDLRLSKDREHVQELLTNGRRTSTDRAYSTDMIQASKLIKELGLYEKDDNISMEDISGDLLFESYIKARNDLKENALKASKNEIESLMATITKEEKKLDKLYEKTGLLRDDSTHFMAKDVSSMKNDNIPFKFRSELSTNIFLNQVYCGMKVCDKLGINYEDAVNKPWMLTKEVLKSDIVFTGFQDKTVPQTKAGVLSTIMGINMQNANPYISFDNLAMVSKGLETFNICANNREKASVASDISSLAMPLANFMDRNYSGEIARNKEELYKKLILIDKENPSLIELTAFGEINPLTGEKGNCCPNSRDMECKDVFVRATEMFNDFATYEAGLANQPLLSNKNVISPKEFIKATIDLACREYNELKTTMPTPSQSQEMIDSRMQAIKETLKDPTAGFMASIDKIASINLGDSAIKNDRLKELSDYCKAFKEGDTKLEIDGYAQTQLAKEQKTLTMDLYFKANKNFDSENLKKPLIKAEDELVKSNKSFNSDVKKLMSASEKLTKSRMEATKAGKKDKANESFKKLTVLDKKIGELQDKELNNLEKAYLDGKMPDEYFKARVVQIMSLNTKDVPTFPSALGKNVTKISTFINGTFTNKPALEQRTKFPEFYKNIVTPSGKVHGNDAPKINAEKAKAVEVAKPTEAKQEAKSVNTAPPAMGK